MPIKIEIVYITPEIQYLTALSLPENISVKQALEISGILKKYPEIDFGKNYQTGIFGIICSLDKILQSGDRIEIYRPIFINPIVNRFEKVKIIKKNKVKTESFKSLKKC